MIVDLKPMAVFIVIWW